MTESASNRSDSIDIQEKWVDGIAVVAVRRAVDVATAPLLTQAIDDVLAREPEALIIDLTEVDFLGTAAMIAQHEAAKSTRLAIVADGPATSRPLKLMGLDDLLRIYPSVDEALTDFQ